MGRAGLDIREVLRQLNSALGGTLVASLAGGTDPNVSYKWAKAGGAQPDAEAVERLRFAYEQWRMVSDLEGDSVARAWFIGANPWLGDETPVNAIRDGQWAAVAAAAKALVDDSFSA